MGVKVGFVQVPTSKLRLIESSAAEPVTRNGGDVFVAARFRSEVFELVYRQMHALAGRAHDLDDLVQNAAEQVLRSLPSFEERCSPSTWTYRICYHTLLKHRRWFQRWNRRFVHELGDQTNQMPDRSTTSGLETLEREERSARLRQALEVISAKRRAVVIMHDLEGMEIEEIAVIVETNVLTVRSRLRDGRRLLAQALQRDPYFGDGACEEVNP